MTNSKVDSPLQTLDSVLQSACKDGLEVVWTIDVSYVRRELTSLDVSFLREVAHYTTLVCTPGDHWFPDWQKSRIEQFISSLKIQTLRGFKHAFPVSVDMSESLSHSLARIIEDRL